jgi:hypothetical protein
VPLETSIDSVVIVLRRRRHELDACSTELFNRVLDVRRQQRNVLNPFATIVTDEFTRPVAPS